jgi:hypothetical protein
MVTMTVDGHRLNAEVVLLESRWQVLIKYVVSLRLAFLDGAVLVGFLHCWSCLGHCENGTHGGHWLK